MTDQAQGLRALADHVRGDQSSPSSPPAVHLGESLPLLDASHAVVTQAESNQLDLNTECDVAGNTLNNASAVVRDQRAARIIAVTSGKGGVGKSNFSTNLSLTLGQLGQRVIMLDADLGLANLHLLLGAIPRYSLEHVMQGKKTLNEALHKGPCGVQLIAGGSGITELADLPENVRQAFLVGLRELDNLADVIIVDTGAGIARNVLAFLSAVEEVVVMTTPEPTAITDAYATIKIVSQENPSARIMLVVNMVNSSREGEAVGDRLVSVARQYLNIQLEYLGCIPSDPMVGKAVRMREPFVLSHPGCPASKSIAKITGKMGYRRRREPEQVGINAFLSRMQHFLRFAKSKKDNVWSDDVSELARLLLNSHSNQ